MHCTRSYLDLPTGRFVMGFMVRLFYGCVDEWKCVFYLMGWGGLRIRQMRVGWVESGILMSGSQHKANI
jgi:hypothetical protein